MNPDEYILWHRNGGWMTRSATYHSDVSAAWVVPRDEALRMCKLHDGKLLPVEKALYQEVFKK